MITIKVFFWNKKMLVLIKIIKKVLNYPKNFGFQENGLKILLIQLLIKSTVFTKN